MNGPDLRHRHSGPWMWWPDGDDAICTCCGERAEGAADWARVQLSYVTAPGFVTQRVEWEKQRPADWYHPVRGWWFPIFVGAVWFAMVAVFAAVLVVAVLRWAGHWLVWPG